MWFDDNVNKITIALMVLLAGVVLFNTMQISNLRSLELSAAPVTGAASTDGSHSASFQGLPSGVPRIYGAELGVSFDDVSVSNPTKADATIRKLGALDQQISLSGADKVRYIRIASQISCEYCCGVPSIIFETGEAACGCAHSFAMRGVAKYLVKNHGAEFTDDQILEELSKWKALFFPSAMATKADALQNNGIEVNFINLASNQYRGIESQVAASSASSSGAGQVGGC